jgi:hypothetical protein
VSAELFQEHWLRDAGALARRFREAQPFPHVVIDGFLREEVVSALLREFPPFERGNCTNEDGLPGLKSTFEAIGSSAPASPPSIDRCVILPSFPCWVRSRDRRPVVRPRIRRRRHPRESSGTGLDPHVDFNYHPSTGWHRRLNLLLYLNADVARGMGGCLELHRDAWRPDADEVATVLRCATAA